MILEIFFPKRLFIRHFRNFSVLRDKKNFLKNFFQNFGKIALYGVVGSDRKIRGFGKHLAYRLGRR